MSGSFSKVTFQDKSISVDDGKRAFAPLPLIDAIKMVRAYHCNADKLDIKINGNTETLKGIFITKEIIAHLSQMIADNEDITNFLLLIAVSYDKVSVKEGDDQEFTTIIAPILNDKKIDGSNLINKFLPCPDNCNSDIEESYHCLFFNGNEALGSDCRDQREKDKFSNVVCI